MSFTTAVSTNAEETSPTEILNKEALYSNELAWNAFYDEYKKNIYLDI